MKYIKSLQEKLSEYSRPLNDIEITHNDNTGVNYFESIRKGLKKTVLTGLAALTIATSTLSGCVGGARTGLSSTYNISSSLNDFFQMSGTVMVCYENKDPTAILIDRNGDEYTIQGKDKMSGWKEVSYNEGKRALERMKLLHGINEDQNYVNTIIVDGKLAGVIVPFGNFKKISEKVVVVDKVSSLITKGGNSPASTGQNKGGTDTGVSGGEESGSGAQ